MGGSKSDATKTKEEGRAERTKGSQHSPEGSKPGGRKVGGRGGSNRVGGRRTRRPRNSDRDNVQSSPSTSQVQPSPSTSQVQPSPSTRPATNEESSQPTNSETETKPELQGTPKRANRRRRGRRFGSASSNAKDSKQAEETGSARGNVDDSVDSALTEASAGESVQTIIVATSDSGSVGNQGNEGLNFEKNKENKAPERESKGAVGRDVMSESDKAKESERGSPAIGSDDRTDLNPTQSNGVKQSMQEPNVELRSVSTNIKHKEEV